MVSRKIPTEHQEQTVLVQRIRFLYPHLADNVYAVPNGGARGKREAARLKDEGVLSGAPDLVVDLVRGPWPGLRIEMKRQKGGQVSDNQKRVHAALRAEGYRVEVARGAEAAWDIFQEYIGS